MADTYTITQQSPDIEPNPAGTMFMNGWKINYRVTSGPAQGTNGSVFVTDEQHNAQTVGAMIEAKIKDLADIAALGK